MEFVFETSPWEQALERLHAGEKLSALQALSLLQELTDEEAEESLTELEARGIVLDISDLPQSFGSGETAARLHREQKLAQEGTLLQALEENDPLGLYLQELAAIPAAGDVTLLAEQLAAGDSEVSQQLVNLCLSRVVDAACRMTGRGVLLLDLIQEGSLGLWQGILSYTGGDFYAHIDWWVSQYLAKTVFMQARSGEIGQKLRTALSDFRDADQRLLAEFGRNPTLAEIAEAIHITEEEAAICAELLAQVRLRNQVDQAFTQKEESPDDGQAVENTAYFQARQRVLDMLSTLPEQEAKLLTLRFGLEGGLPKNTQQTAEILGLTPEEVTAAEAAALEKLRRK